MGGMSTRNEIKARLGILAEPPAKAKATMAVNIGGARSRQKIVGGTWLKGTWDGGTWGALVFPEPSESYGIPEFPYISKLYMNPAGKPGFNDVVVNYDRGWDVKPSTPALQKAFQEIGRAVTAQVKSSSSRPGAKAKMGFEGRYVNAFRDAMQMMEASEDLEPRSALKQAASDHGIPFGEEMRKFVEWAEKRFRSSRPGAKATHAAADKPGRKVMAESDPAVSAKIRKLMAEGKPQKQAVAIALDMKRRGEI